MKPFFSNQLNCVVVDEKCECGHSKSEHGSQSRAKNGEFLRLPHEGSCCGDLCACSQYTWAGWITEEEATETILARRCETVGL